uniref:Uncharacterized protein n=1 Tax=Eubacterium cellulosolvens (strain ATCC 43171 / JCM 9499 / 6) TaxID=633697 RepID=I5AUF8_EUBC6
MESIKYYTVAVIFGAIALLFLIYPFVNKFKFGEKLLYIAIGVFFGTLSGAMFFHNGILIEMMLGIMIGGLLFSYGVGEMIGVITHHIKVNALLVKIQKFRRRKSYHYKLTFQLLDRQATYFVENESFVGKYVEGKLYPIHISNRGNKAYIHRPLCFILGMFTACAGVLFLFAAFYVFL